MFTGSISNLKDYSMSLVSSHYELYRKQWQIFELITQKPPFIYMHTVPGINACQIYAHNIINFWKTPFAVWS